MGNKKAGLWGAGTAGGLVAGVRGAPSPAKRGSGAVRGPASVPAAGQRPGAHCVRRTRAWFRSFFLVRGPWALYTYTYTPPNPTHLPSPRRALIRLARESSPCVRWRRRGMGAPDGRGVGGCATGDTPPTGGGPRAAYIHKRAHGGALECRAA